MACQSRLMEILPREYGYVLLVGMAGNFVNMWMARRVRLARIEYRVEYPQMYSDDSNVFNCVQRAHQNTMEMQPTFLFLLLVGGLKHPRLCAGAGAVYLVGRIQFARGYYTGDPTKRHMGAFGMLGLLVMKGALMSTIATLMGWCKTCH